jgi:hypothetical protein
VQSCVGLLQKLEGVFSAAPPKAIDLAKGPAVNDVVSVFNQRIRRSKLYIVMASFEISGKLREVILWQHSWHHVLLQVSSAV